MGARLRFELLMTGVVACLVGCAPNANGVMRPTLPWTRQVPATPGETSPWGTAEAPLSAAPNLPAPNNQRGWSFLNDLMKRANQQESLAERQRQQLAELRLLQKEQEDKDRQILQQQRAAERAALARQYAEKEQQLAEKEKKYRGRYDQMRGKATDLDANNRDLHAQLARSEKERELLADEIDLLKRRLADTTRQLSQTRNVSQETGRRLQALQASASKQRGNATLRANSSVKRPVTAVMVPGMDIRQDGDLVRISIPNDKLFMTGQARLHQGSTAYMDQVANILRQYYPQQIAGIEAHTDHASTAINNSQWTSHHQLTAAQSVAVFEQLTSRGISPHQLFVLGYGGNHPRVSDGTPQGQSINRRIEIVIYPEMYGQ